MSTTQHITREALDKANFGTKNYSTGVNTLSRRLEAMFPEEPNGILVVEAKISIPKLTLGEIYFILTWLIHIPLKVMIDLLLLGLNWSNQMILQVLMYK